jgi:hypothetical protein
MNKQSLENFIKKYMLGGAVEKAILTVTDASVSTRVASEGNKVIAEISVEPAFLPAGTYNIYETSKLRSLLAVLDETIDITLSENNGKLTAIHFKDTTTKSTFALADKEAIPPISMIKKMPPFEIGIIVNKKFVDGFIKSKNAINADTFVIMNDGTGTKIVIGYEKFNSTRITLTPETEYDAVFDPMHFTSEFIKDIFMANKEATEGTMRVSSAGICHITFTVPNFTINYYLPKVTV